MNIFSNTIRGIGCEVKRSWLRNCRVQNQAFFVGLQETKSLEVKNKLDKQIWGSSNFQCDVIDPVGLSGGIASLWDPSLFQILESIKGEGFFAIKGLWLRLRKICCFVNVYAPQEPWRKKALWNKLADLINSDAESCWIVFGDFNVVRFPEERLGSVFCQSSAYYFNEFIHSLGLLEIKIGGRRFTYMNSTGDKHSKLDRFLDLGFEGVLRSGWVVSCNPGRQLFLSPLSLVAGKLKNLKEHIKLWRKESNGTAKKEMEEFTNKIKEFDLMAEEGRVNNEMLKNRQEAYQKIMEIESNRIEDLKQKSRSKWALEGDENNAFFHGLINKHHRSQRINGIKENGFWISDPVEIKERVFKHFAGRFTEPIKSRPKFISSKFLKLPPYAIEYLEEPFSLAEVKSAIWACGPDRAPGPEGFSFTFLKQH
ncbi:uncharacterized protein LOC111901792 [Lactuca sativa]|uniref:uncharacterized protein LOC111901792 n=1 Tax=Lactuca sativa TaxID=4236 RepID=UPI000CD91956|nr:uncharacterized protein LOC111901792 [Lactuca sativa]